MMRIHVTNYCLIIKAKYKFYLEVELKDHHLNLKMEQSIKENGWDVIEMDMG
jgi:hypothetical protein